MSSKSNKGIFAGEKTQRFFNFAYSIGAAIVIWGALFKILHLTGGNTLLSIGMGTEVLMFVLTAFEKPPREYHWERVFPALDSGNEEDRPNFAGGGGGGVIVNGVATTSAVSIDGEVEGSEVAAQGVIGGGGVIIAGGGNVNGIVTPAAARNAVGLPAGIELSEEDTESLSQSIARMNAAAEQLSQMASLTEATQQYLSQMAAISEQMQLLRQNTESLNNVTSTLLESYRAITENSDNITQNSTGYVEQMQDLNRNIGGLNTIYEIQLKSVSGQLDAIDRVNRGVKDIRDMYEKSAQNVGIYSSETEKMVRYMQQLNAVYEKMITAMTINMYRPMMGGDIPGFNPQQGGGDQQNN